MLNLTDDESSIASSPNPSADRPAGSNCGWRTRRNGWRGSTSGSSDTATQAVRRVATWNERPMRSMAASIPARLAPAASSSSRSSTASRACSATTAALPLAPAVAATSMRDCQSPSAVCPRMRNVPPSGRSPSAMRTGAPAYRSGSARGLASSSTSPSSSSPVTSGAASRASRRAMAGSAHSSSPSCTSTPRPARAHGLVSERLEAGPTPTQCSREPAGRSRLMAPTTACSKPTRPSVISTTWRCAWRRFDVRARSTPETISVPPDASSDWIQATAARRVETVPGCGRHFQARGALEKAIISSRSHWSRLWTRAMATCCACASGAPLIEPLVSSSSTRSRGTGASTEPGCGGTSVSRP